MIPSDVVSRLMGIEETSSTNPTVDWGMLKNFQEGEKEITVIINNHLLDLLETVLIFIQINTGKIKEIIEEIRRQKENNGDKNGQKKVCLTLAELSRTAINLFWGELRAAHPELSHRKLGLRRKDDEIVIIDLGDSGRNLKSEISGASVFASEEH